MGILVDGQTRVCVQGITGRAGRMQARYMLEAGTRTVSGVTPGKGGEVVEGIPVFNTMAAAQAVAPADVSILFVPPAVAEEAATQALGVGIKLVVLITEGVPVHSALRLRARAQEAGARLIGPTTPGLIAPGRTKIGIMPARFYSPGPVGLLSRSGTLSYEIGAQLSAAGLGQSTVVGLGADPVVGTGMAELLELFAADPQTEAVVLVGEVGGGQEEAAGRVAATMDKPVVAYIAGHSVPAGVRMGHAGAIVQGGTGSAAEKLRALEQAGVHTARQPGQVAGLVREALKGRI